MSAGFAQLTALCYFVLCSLHIAFFSVKPIPSSSRARPDSLDPSDDDTPPLAAVKKGTKGRGRRSSSVGPAAPAAATGLEPDMWPKVYCLDIDYLAVAQAAVRWEQLFLSGPPWRRSGGRTNPMHPHAPPCTLHYPLTCVPCLALHLARNQI